MIKGYADKFVNPLYRTTNMSYGSTKPNVHTMPTNYNSKSSAFTEVLIQNSQKKNISIKVKILINSFFQDLRKDWYVQRQRLQYCHHKKQSHLRLFSLHCTCSFFFIFSILFQSLLELICEYYRFFFLWISYK